MDGPGSDIAHCVLEHGNGDVYVGGFTNSFSGDHDLYLARYGPDQQLVWAKRYHLGGNDGGMSICMASGPSGALYLGGSYNGIGTNQEDGSLMKLDEDGNVLWARGLVPQPAYCQVRGIAEAPDGSVGVVGSLNSFGAGNADSYMARFTANGSLQWLNSFGWSGQDHFTDVQWLGDGTIMAGSQSMGPGGPRKGYVARIGGDGVPVSTRLHLGGVYDTYNHVLRNADGSFLWVGYTESYGAGGRDVLAVLADSLGQPIWSRAYGTNLNEDGLNAIADGAGGWFLSAFQGPTRQVNIVHLGSDGDLLGVWEIDGLGMDATASWNPPLARTSTGDVYVVGSGLGGTPGLVLQKLDACAQTGCGVTMTMWNMAVFSFSVQNVQLPVSGSSSNVVSITVQVNDVTPQVLQLAETIDCDTCVVSVQHPDVLACVGEVVEISPLLTGGDPLALVWSWDLGDGTTGSSVGGITHSYLAEGDYEVLLAVHDTSGGCVDSLSFVVSVAEVPIPDLGSDTTLCGGASLVLQADMSGPWSVLWSDGSGGSELPVTAAGEHWVEYSYGACSERDTILVSFVAVPAIDLGPDTVLCSGEVLVLVVPDDFSSIFWQDGSSASTLSLDTAGIYWVAVEHQGCMAVDTLEVTVMEPPMVDLGSDVEACTGTEVILATGLTGLQHVWSNGSVATELAAISTGTYWVTVGPSGCTGSDTVNVSLLPVPNVDLGPDTLLCGVSEYVLTSGYPDANSTWHDGVQSSIRTVTTSGTYSVLVDLDGCMDTDSITIVMAELPQLTLPGDTVLCEARDLLITATVSPGASVIWQDGSTGLVHSAGSPGWYAATASNGCGTVWDSIHVGLAPPVELPDTLVTCPGEPVSIDWSEELTAILWGHGSTASSLDLDIGLYHYSGSDTYGCPYAGVLHVIWGPAVDGLSFVPNVFTPNGDGYNDRFSVVGAEQDGFSLEVYNRWGELIFGSSSPAVSWDGRYKGENVPDGTYVYVVSYKTACGDVGRVTRHGHVTLLR